MVIIIQYRLYLQYLQKTNEQYKLKIIKINLLHNIA